MTKPVILNPPEPRDVKIDKATARLPAETFAFFILGHEIHASIARLYPGGPVHEIVFLYNATGMKWGQWLPKLFHDLGICLSRAIQEREPETGA